VNSISKFTLSEQIFKRLIDPYLFTHMEARFLPLLKYYFLTLMRSVVWQLQ